MNDKRHFATPEEAFEARTIRRSNGCLEWTGALIKDGYGMLKVEGVSTLAHRYSFSRKHGSIPQGMKVLHRCDNPCCVEVEHLFLGTDKDNMDDMHAKGRARKASGAGHGRTRLSEDDVRRIRKDPRSLIEIAEDYGMSKSAIGYIKDGTNWRHVK